MNDLKQELIKMGEDHKDLRQDLSVVIDHLEEENDQEKQAASVTRDMNSIIRGDKIFGLKDDVGEQVQKVLVENGLIPKTGAVSFDSNLAKVVIICNTSQEFVQNPSRKDATYVAKKAAQRVEMMGYNIIPDANVNPKRGNVIISLGQNTS